MIFAIDPGNIESAYVLLDENLKPLEHGKFVNDNVRSYLRLKCQHNPNLKVVIEKIQGLGMPVGQTTFDTCIWIGRFTEIVESCNMNTYYIYRKEEKLNLCGSLKAKDSNIIQALVDRFAPNTSNKGKGTKKNPGWFYGFSKDIWQAYAVGVTYNDMYLK
jgi:hypothetical protein